MNFFLRPADETDSERIAILCTELGYPVDAAAMELRLAPIVNAPDHFLFVAENPDKSLAGWIHSFANHNVESGFRVEIAGLVVLASSRRKGVGRLLVDAAEHWARGLGAKTIVVRSNESRRESHQFYPALGYAPAKKQIVYRKSLSSP